MSVMLLLSRAVSASISGMLRSTPRSSPSFVNTSFRARNLADRHHKRIHPIPNRHLSTYRLSSFQPLDISINDAPQEPFKVNLLTLPISELETLIKSWNHPAFRARQIHNWIFSQGVKDIDQMTDLPLKLRDTLKERAIIGSLHLEIEQISNDGTKKRAYKLHDGQMIESVLMPYEDGRRTACISSQAGCGKKYTSISFHY